MYKQQNKTKRRSIIGFVILLLLISTTGQTELRDPTRPPLFIDAGKTMHHDELLTLSAIWSTATTKRATINGMIVKQGDTILNNIKIIEIQPRMVIIKQQDTIQKLSLFSKPIKNTLSTYHP